MSTPTTLNAFEQTMRQQVRHDKLLDGNSTNTWLTPPELIKALGPFDLDPCTPPAMPWPTANRMLTKADDGLATPWAKGDFVFMNPPYSRRPGASIDHWMIKLAEHGNGIALVFPRVETRWFHDQALQHENATAVLFTRGRLKFCRADGTCRGPAPLGSVFVGFGEEAAKRLQKAVRSGDIRGRLILLNEGNADTWRLGPGFKAKIEVGKAVPVERSQRRHLAPWAFEAMAAS